MKTGKELEAVCFACESGLTEKFAPAPLLKNILHNSKKKAHVIAKNGNHSAAAIVCQFSAFNFTMSIFLIS